MREPERWQNGAMFEVAAATAVTVMAVMVMAVLAAWLRRPTVEDKMRAAAATAPRVPPGAAAVLQ